MVFKDSLQFLGSILATVSKNLLKTGMESFKQLSKKFLGLEAREFRLLVRKGVYPYEYMDCWEKMDEQHLPPKRPFTPSSQTSASATRTTNTPITYGTPSTSRRCAATTTTTC